MYPKCGGTLLWRSMARSNLCEANNEGYEKTSCDGPVEVQVGSFSLQISRKLLDFSPTSHQYLLQGK